MTDQMQTIRDDLAYLRALAEEGRDGGERGGAIIMTAGLVFSACSVLEWAAHVNLVAEGASAIGWLAGAVVFFAVMGWIIARGGKASGRSQAAGLAWSGVGWSIFTLFVALAVATWRTQNALLISFFPSIILALYGAAWMVASAVSRKGWVKVTALGSYLATIVCAWFIADPVQYLIYAASLLLLAALPGYLLMRQDPQKA